MQPIAAAPIAAVAQQATAAVMSNPTAMVAAAAAAQAAPAELAAAPRPTARGKKRAAASGAAEAPKEKVTWSHEQTMNLIYLFFDPEEKAKWNVSGATAGENYAELASRFNLVHGYNFPAESVSGR
jgi:hypothetical protein